MPYRILQLVITFIVGTQLALAQAPAAANDPNAAVIELFYLDATVPAAEPELTVYANGRVRVKVGTGDIWASLTTQQIEILVHQLLRVDDLGSLTTQAIEQDIQQAAQNAGGLSTRFANAGTTRIRIRTTQGVHQIDVHAVGLSSSRFPAAAKLQKVAGAQDRLENLRAVVMVGGIEAAQRLAKLAAQQLARERGERITVSAQDLRMVRSMGDGSRYCQFVVRPADRAATSWVVSLMEAPGVAPQVTVLPDGRQLQ